MFFFEGLSQSEIARRLGVSQQVVQKRLYGAKRGGVIVGGAVAKLREALAHLVRAMSWERPTGHVRSGSDIDLHVFAEDSTDVTAHVKHLGWVHEVQHVSILKHGKVQEFVHVHVPNLFPLELTVSAPPRLGRPRSRADGNPSSASALRPCAH